MKNGDCVVVSPNLYLLTLVIHQATLKTLPNHDNRLTNDLFLAYFVPLVLRSIVFFCGLESTEIEEG